MKVITVLALYSSILSYTDGEQRSKKGGDEFDNNAISVISVTSVTEDVERSGEFARNTGIRGETTASPAYAYYEGLIDELSYLTEPGHSIASPPSQIVSPSVPRSPTRAPIVENNPKPAPIVEDNPTPAPIAEDNPTPTPISPTPAPISPTPAPISPTPAPIAEDNPTPAPISTTPAPISTTPDPISTTPAPIAEDNPISGLGRPGVAPILPSNKFTLTYLDISNNRDAWIIDCDGNVDENRPGFRMRYDVEIFHQLSGLNAGKAYGICTKVTDEGKMFLCNLHFHLLNGSIMVGGMIRFSGYGAYLSIMGGTLDYAGVTGTVSHAYTPGSSDEYQLVFDIMYPR
eukprot:CAMPEP_0194158892 /NCGR_PEP_ID=MMETSP0152-20130528/77528_1 /TAXON_ID=1049557 /ORGANISM="Thalassiothrix antarctica, Strain L6-D1" /LENGTH=344 /DNA_ID=CAMNT_0038868399 /DNA_START=138 /DNA_END=1172 /DNA_ORIENTATION=-